MTKTVHTLGKTLGPFKLVSLLGAGLGGEVRAALDARHSPVALKVFKSGTPLQAARAEFEANRLLDHPNILKSKSFQVFDNLCVIVLPYCEGRSVDNVAGYFTEETAWKLIFDIGSALACLHGKGLCHGDVKPSNILRSGNDFLLADFGSCFSARSQAVPGDLSSYQFSAPEKERNEKSDIWSLGATVFHLVMGSHVFNGLGGKAQGRDSVLPYMRKTMPGLSELVLRCLSFHPDQRPDALELVRVAEKNLKLIKERVSVRPAKQPVNASSKDAFESFWPEEMKDAL